ncbi:MAG TPA: 3-hydroxyacyl-CoA dehydrogenase NAD-binding domain-containing protein [Agriterribacter sp.]|nr:3-hydroxybutyryl-CoA dehydrogenase [Chitinophagaceae bacterium]HRP30649.1 3-hydroxyacyl-CoA dehydrogenase NAD-binding domain-containing protein [Agriterribacter sp.]
MIKNIAVIGAGTMGNGIAHVFAQFNFNVTLTDNNETALGKAIQTISRNAERQVNKGIISQATKDRIMLTLHTATTIEEGVNHADLVIEAATENIETKTAIFKQLDLFAPATAILATNTSSISITALAAVTHRPEKVIGMHFMNPVPVMQLVEVINGYATHPEVTTQIVEISKALHKIPCVVNDYPGFVANRILMPMINESIFCVYERIAGITEIDTVMKLGMAHPMGPLQLADFIGLDVCLSILQVLFKGFGNPKYAPCPLLVNMVAAGNLGIKTGEGFYKYTPGSKEMVAAF